MAFSKAVMLDSLMAAAKSVLFLALQAGEALGFLQDFPICILEAEGDVALVTSVPEVQPAWVQVDADRTPDAESVLHQLPLPDLRFLLRDADTIVQLYATRQ